MATIANTRAWARTVASAWAHLLLGADGDTQYISAGTRTGFQSWSLTTGIPFDGAPPS